MKINPDYTYAVVNDSVVIVNLKMKKTDVMLEMNDVGAALMDALTIERSQTELLEILKDRFDFEEGRLESELDHVLDTLIKYRVVLP